MDCQLKFGYVTLVSHSSAFELTEPDEWFHGLHYIAAAGKAHPEATGLVAAVAQQVAKLEPSLPPPVILLEADNRYATTQVFSTFMTMFPLLPICCNLVSDKPSCKMTETLNFFSSNRFCKQTIYAGLFCERVTRQMIKMGIFHSLHCNQCQLHLSSIVILKNSVPI